MKFVVSMFFVLATVVLSARAGAATITIQPPTQDGFVYSGDGLDAFSASSLTSFFPKVLAISDFAGQAHNANSYLQFSLSQLAGLSASQIVSASLQLQGVSGAVGFIQNPTTALPVTADLFAVTSAWNPTTVSWDVAPTIGSLAGQATITSGTQLTTFDVKSIVQGWLNNPSTNFGFQITQDAVVNGGAQGAVFNSSTATSGQPLLLITTATLATPEPSSAVLAAVGIAGLAAYRWSRKGFRRA